jgi:hypothetical protein
MYLATASTEKVRDAMRSGRLGLMAQPGNSLGPSMVPGTPWAADNGCFSARWDADRWLAWLRSNVDHRGSCLFAVVPDVVADHTATLVRWAEWAPVVRELGYPLAFVLQDGAMTETVPWGEFECLFIGGSTEFKLSAEARAIAEEARTKGAWVHMGRVNSAARCRLAAAYCDSVDGTYLAFGPDVNLPKLLRFVDAANRYAAMPTIFDALGASDA